MCSSFHACELLAMSAHTDCPRHVDYATIQSRANGSSLLKAPVGKNFHATNVAAYESHLPTRYVSYCGKSSSCVLPKFNKYINETLSTL